MRGADSAPAARLPIALAAIEAGKPVYCEKPLAPNAADAKRMAGYIRTQLAKAGVKRMDTNYFTKHRLAGGRNSSGIPFLADTEDSAPYQRNLKSQQAVKALEYVLSKAGEPAE